MNDDDKIETFYVIISITIIYNKRLELVLEKMR